VTSQNVYDDRKWCAKCDRRFHVREFASKPYLSSGLDSWCRGCRRAATREWRAKNGEAILARRRAAYAAALDRPVRPYARKAT
jgi:hypothetical protein